MRIWKWTLEIVDYQTLEMPIDSKILCVQMQGLSLQLWAICDEEALKEERYFVIYGTGNPLSDNNWAENYIGTVQDSNGSLVWHVFETIKRPFLNLAAKYVNV